MTWPGSIVIVSASSMASNLVREAVRAGSAIHPDGEFFSIELVDAGARNS
jgi:hypothetical protein